MADESFTFLSYDFSTQTYQRMAEWWEEGSKRNGFQRINPNQRIISGEIEISHLWENAQIDREIVKVNQLS